MRYEANAVMTADGLQGLWRGVLPSLYRTVPGVGLYFSSMHWMRYNVFNGKPNAGQSLLIGAAARTFAGSVMIPFTVVKTRMESGAFQYRSVFTALSSILCAEGLRGLTRGGSHGRRTWRWSSCQPCHSACRCGEDPDAARQGAQNILSPCLHLQGGRSWWICCGFGTENAAKKRDGGSCLDRLREDHHLSQAQVERLQDCPRKH